MACEIFSTFAIAVQLVLGLTIIIVLAMEYAVEIWRFNSGRRDTAPRPFAEFWTDSVKLCCGAFMSHIFNVFVALIITYGASSTDQCALYTISYYYETTGVTFVELLQYGLVKYARRMYLATGSMRMFYVANPGHYPLNGSKDLSSAPTMHEYWDHFERTDVALILLATTALTVAAVLFSYYVLGYTAWVVIVIALASVVIFVSLGIMFYTKSILWQVLGWMFVCGTEKFIWTIAVMSGKADLLTYATTISFQSDDMEAVVYLALIPMVITIFMFLLFSQVARFHIPFLNDDDDDEEDAEFDEEDAREELISGVDRDTLFDLRETLRIGVWSTLVLNLVLYIPAVLALETLQAAGTLFWMMVVFPLGMAFFLTLMLYVALNPPLTVSMIAEHEKRVDPEQRRLLGGDDDGDSGGDEVRLAERTFPQTGDRARDSASYGSRGALVDAGTSTEDRSPPRAAAAPKVDESGVGRGSGGAGPAYKDEL